MEEETPLRPRVSVPRHPGWKPEASRLLLDRASTLAVERGIGLQSSTSALLPSLAASASETLQQQVAIASCTPTECLNAAYSTHSVRYDCRNCDVMQ